MLNSSKKRLFLVLKKLPFVFSIVKWQVFEGQSCKWEATKWSNHQSFFIVKKKKFWADPRMWEINHTVSKRCICYYYYHLLFWRFFYILSGFYFSEIQAHGPQGRLRAVINSWYSFSSYVCISSSSWPSFEVMHGKLTWKVKRLFSSAPDVSAFSLPSCIWITRAES